MRTRPEHIAVGIAILAAGAYLPDLSKEYLDDPPDLAPESRF